MGLEQTKQTPKKERAARLDTSWHATFLKVFGQSLNVVHSAMAAGVSRAVVYEHRKKLKTFAKQMAHAKAEAIDRLEAEAFDRAQKQSDTLLIFLLKAHRPKRYREKIENKLSGDVLLKVEYGSDGSTGETNQN